jgi:hypothetical protein
MARETVDEKARRLLGEGRVTVVRAEFDEIDATVTGDSGKAYVVVHRPGGWRCRCVATVDRCSHVVAVGLVTAVPSGGWNAT